MKLKDLEVGQAYGYKINPNRYGRARKATVLEIGIHGEVQGHWKWVKSEKAIFVKVKFDDIKGMYTKAILSRCLVGKWEDIEKEVKELEAREQEFMAKREKEDAHARVIVKQLKEMGCESAYYASLMRCIEMNVKDIEQLLGLIDSPKEKE